MVGSRPVAKKFLTSVQLFHYCEVYYSREGIHQTHHRHCRSRRHLVRLGTVEGERSDPGGLPDRAS